MKVSALMLCAFLILILTENNYAQDKYTLEEIIGISIERSPKLKMLHSKMDAARSRKSQNSNLPDPVLSIGLVNMPVNSFSFTQEPMTGKLLSLSQGIPFPGKLQTIEDAASIDELTVQQEINEEVNRIKRDVSNTFMEYQFYKKTLTIIKQKKKLIRSISSVVKTKYSVGEASQQNILNTDLTLTELDDRIEEQKSLFRTAEEKLKAYMLTHDSIIVQEHSEETGFPNDSVSHSSVIELIRNNRPLLKQISLLKKKAELQTSVSEYDFYPDFKLTLQYNQRDNIAATGTNLNDFVSVIVGLNLPINYGGKKTSKVEENRSIVEYFKHLYDSNLQIIRIELERILAGIYSLQKRKTLIEQTKLIQASENFKSSLSAYQVSMVDFVNVIQSVNSLLDIEIEKERIEKDLHQELANLEFMIGNELTEFKNEK